MELNWELCRIFYQVARCRNFSRAAAMSIPGTILSQEPSNTKPSSMEVRV